MRYVGLAILLLVMLACASSSSDLPPGISPPRVVHKVDPEYPAELRREGVTGVVTIQALIDKTGRLLQPRVVRSADHRLDALALAAVARWTFKPGTVNGEPVDIPFLVDVSFSIP